MNRQAVAIFLLCLPVFIFTTNSLIKISTSYTPDFSIFYYSAFDILYGINPYTDSNLFSLFPYPLLTLFVYIPFLLVSYEVAQILFTLLNVLSLLLICFVSLKLLQGTVSFIVYMLTLSGALLSFPVKFTFGMGQSNLIAYALLLLSVYLYSTKKPMASSFFLSLSILIKPVLIFMLLFFILRKQWYILVNTSLILLFVFSLSVIVFGKEANSFFFQNIVPHLMTYEGREVYYIQGIIGFISRIFEDITLRKILTLLLSGILLVFSLNTIKGKISHIYSLAIVCTLLPLIDTLSWQHHFVFLLFPFIFAFITVINNKNFFNFFLLLISYILVSMNIKNPEILSIYPLLLLQSHVTYGTILLLGVIIVSGTKETNLFFSNYKKSILKKWKKPH